MKGGSRSQFIIIIKRRFSTKGDWVLGIKQGVFVEIFGRCRKTLCVHRIYLIIDEGRALFSKHSFGVGGVVGVMG